MNPINSLLPFVPEKYRAWVVLAFAASPYITRTVYALMNGRGLKGVLSAIWLGTNTPKPVVTVGYSVTGPTGTTPGQTITTATTTLLSLLAILALCGCRTWNDSCLTPDSFNYTMAVDQKPFQPAQHYFGLSWNLKHESK